MEGDNPEEAILKSTMPSMESRLKSPVNSCPLFLGGGDGGAAGWLAFFFPLSRFSFLRVTEGDDMLGDGTPVKTLLLYTGSGRGGTGGRSDGCSVSSESARKLGLLWRVLSLEKENSDDFCLRNSAEWEDEPL